MPVIEDHVRLLESHRRRIGNGHCRIVEAQRALKTAVARVSDRPVHGSRELQLGRKLRAHIGGELHQRLHRKAVPVHRHGPMRPRKIIADPEMRRERRRRIARRPGLQLQLLRRSDPAVR